MDARVAVTDGSTRSDAAGLDAGGAGVDSGSTVGVDAGSTVGVDAGSTVGVDAGSARLDAGRDAGGGTSVCPLLCAVGSECCLATGVATCVPADTCGADAGPRCTSDAECASPGLPRACCLATGSCYDTRCLACCMITPVP